MKRWEERMGEDWDISDLLPQEISVIHIICETCPLDVLDALYERFNKLRIKYKGEKPANIYQVYEWVMGIIGSEIARRRKDSNMEIPKLKNKSQKNDLRDCLDRWQHKDFFNGDTKVEVQTLVDEIVEICIRRGRF